MPSSVIANPTDWCSVTSFLYHGPSIAKYAVTACWDAPCAIKAEEEDAHHGVETKPEVGRLSGVQAMSCMPAHAAGMPKLLERNQDTGSGT